MGPIGADQPVGQHDQSPADGDGQKPTQSGRLEVLSTMPNDVLVAGAVIRGK